MPRRKMTQEEKDARDYRKVVKQLKEGIERSLWDVQRQRIPEPAYLHKAYSLVLHETK